MRTTLWGCYNNECWGKLKLAGWPYFLDIHINQENVIKLTYRGRKNFNSHSISILKYPVVYNIFIFVFSFPWQDLDRSVRWWLRMEFRIIFASGPTRTAITDSSSYGENVLIGLNWNTVGAFGPIDKLGISLFVRCGCVKQALSSTTFSSVARKQTDD